MSDERIKKLEKQLADARTEKEWVISRLDEELKAIGVTIQWTDGGGWKCPSGWHRNPYINVGSIDGIVRQALATSKEAVERAMKVNRELGQTREALNIAVNFLKGMRAHSGAVADDWPTQETLEEVIEFVERPLADL